jgi:hypothetical protein
MQSVRVRLASRSSFTIASANRAATVRAGLALRGELAFRSSPREGSVSPGRPARTGVCRTGIPPARIRMVLEGQPLCCPQYKPGVHERDGTRPSDSASRDWPMNIFSLQNRFRSGTELAGPLFHKANALEMVCVDSFLRRDNGRCFARDSEGPRRGSY